jgi:uncharacterized protein (DUF3820 family)
MSRKVKWTETKPLHRIPERFWGEDLSLLDTEYEGDIIDTHTNFFGEVYIIVMCTDGKVRTVSSELAKEFLSEDSMMPWGKYDHIKMRDVPEKYLRFLYNEGKVDAPVKAYIEEYLNYKGIINVTRG